MACTRQRALIAVVCAGLACAGRGAWAQKLDAQQLHPAATSSSYMGLDSPSVLPHLRGGAGLSITYGRDPLMLRDRDGNLAPGGHLLRNQAWLEAVGSLGLLDRLEVGLALPIALTQSGDAPPPGRDLAAPLRGERGAALGDLRLDVKVLLLDHLFGHVPDQVIGQAAKVSTGDAADIGHRLRLALVVGLTMPTSTTSLAGEGNVTGRPRLVFEWGYRRVRLLAEVGAIFRERVELLGLDLTHQVTWGLGLRVITWRSLEVLAESRGAVGVALPQGRDLEAVEAPAELDFGLAYSWAIGVRAYAAGGVGLGTGYGTPTGRIVFGVRYTSPEKHREVPWAQRDQDQDGIPNGLDRCLTDPGPRENDGCPDGDLDGDGVVDRLDKCVERAGFAANEGCPDYDSDGDNLPDRVDRCPKEAGPPSNFGCPLPDADHDGVPDAQDRCVDRPGTAENAGCPDVDSDGDGLVDRLDKCPFEAEVYNGVSDDDGCPDAGAALVNLVQKQVAIFEPIVFERVGATERLSPRSKVVVTALGNLLNAHRELTRVRIDGHTDDRGGAMENLDLSLARAQLVRHQLVEVQHVDARRLTAQGFGSSRPVASNATPQGRARNRRIEVTILEGGK